MAAELWFANRDVDGFGTRAACIIAGPAGSALESLLSLVDYSGMVCIEISRRAALCEAIPGVSSLYTSSWTLLQAHNLNHSKMVKTYLLAFGVSWVWRQNFHLGCMTVCKDTEVDFVGTSQPSQDGNDELSMKSSPTSSFPHAPTARPINLVRRVTTGPSPEFLRAAEMEREMERKRQRARKEAKRIMKKIRAYATATARLQRKHKRLCAFAAGSSEEDKENTFWAH
ncbi:hypothetical protein B0H13DRAFT_1855516 [Mycena leptocephala]|nr:hypothetical protein B0H13DRAFT_1855516 [Mycena leptocephala]